MDMCVCVCVRVHVCVCLCEREKSSDDLLGDPMGLKDPKISFPLPSIDS